MGWGRQVEERVDGGWGKIVTPCRAARNREPRSFGETRDYAYLEVPDRGHRALYLPALWSVPPIFWRDTDREPISLLSDDLSASPPEALLAALGSCLSMSIHAGAVSWSIPVRHLAIERSGDLGSGSFWGTREPDLRPSGFEAIAIVADIRADVPRQTLKAHVDHAVLWSPAANTLHNPVHLDGSLTP